MSELEEAFLFHWRLLGGPPLVREHRFAPPRRWRADFAHPESRVLVEVEGGVWSRGRHVRGEGYSRDVAKYNAATALGWAIFRVTGGMLAADPVGCLGPILAAIHERQPRGGPGSGRQTPGGDVEGSGVGADGDAGAPWDLEGEAR